VSARITWVGHSTVLIDLDGVRLLTDPVLRARLTHLRRVAAADQSALRGLDAILVSHVHYDHLDLPSLERLGRSVPIVVPRGAGPLLRRRRFERVLEVDAGDDVAIGNVTVTATHAEHRADRGPFGAKAASLGYVVSGSVRTYFAGDTDLFDAMASLGALDGALIPIWGWGPAAGEGHLDPRKAAQALTLLRPEVAIPIHWGTYRPLHYLNPAWLSEPPEQFRREAAALAPEVELRILPLGGSTELERRITVC
jgi:L-ascorbate metabolism protein UlaG (beta-lactamase superfamily)